MFTKFKKIFYNVITSQTRKIAFYFHRKQFEFEWGGTEQPRWFNHYTDLYYKFRETRNPLWLERGVFSSLAIPLNSKVLELCCGDGFNTFHFYSIRASAITAVDFDLSALEFAKKYNYNSKIDYQFCDIIEGLPNEKFNNIVWDASIEQFSEEQIIIILRNIKNSMIGDGLLSGYTAQGIKGSSSNLSHNRREFESKTDLENFLKLEFTNVRVIETIYHDRTNLYFFASNGKLPLE
jgi:SAM-dependent methyltransferase